jgi:hypothetical protein
MHGKTLPAAVIAAALAAAPAAAQDLAPATERLATFAVVEKTSCSGNNAAFVAGLIGVGAAFVGDLVTGYVGRKLEARKAGLTGSFLANGVADLQVTGRDGAWCLAIARGTFTQGQLIGLRELQQRGQSARAAMQAAQPDFYLEADLTAVDSGTVAGTYQWLLEPHKLDYRATSASTKGKGHKHLTVAIAFSGTTPASGTLPADDKAVAVFRHDFGRLRWGRSYNEPMLHGTASAQQFAGRDKLNVSALVTESEKAGPALEALISAYNDNKDALTGLIEKTIKDTLGAGGE